MMPDSNSKSDDPNLPWFAEQWMAQWRSATPKLQEIRDRELRELNQKKAAKPVRTRKLTHEQARSHGLAIQQAWFMRMRLLELTRREDDDS